MTALPYLEPARVNAGDTVKWQADFPDYPASEGWTLSYTFVNAAVRFVVNADGQHVVNVPPATTGTWVAGVYRWRAQMAKAGEVFTVREGQIEVLASFAAAVDARSQAARALEAVEAVIEGRAGSAVQDYQIAGRQLRHIPIPDLLVLRDRLRADVAREQVASDLARGLAPRGRIQVRFGP